MNQMDTSVYAARRARLFDRMQDGSVAILCTGNEKIRSNDTLYGFRASSDVLYTTGFPEPEAVIVLAPGYQDGEQSGPLVMFVRPRDKNQEIWNGRRAGVQGARELYGADAAYSLDELDKRMPQILEDATALYYTLGVDRGFDGRVFGWLNGLRRRRGKPPAAPNTICDLRPVLHELRLRKDDAEIALLRRSCSITAQAHIAAMKACRPGMHEYELQALIEYIFRSHGCSGPSYETIVGAGANAAILHYTENNAKIQDGDLVLIDAGAEYGAYAGDITRTFPANGKFSPVQRDVYQAVLDAEEAAIDMCVPGATWLEVHEATVHRLTRSMVDLGLLEGDVDALVEDKKYQAFYMHKTGHYLGIDVHDVGPYYSGQEARKLESGVVQTIEPGLYIQPGTQGISEEFWGIGVRIEDDVLTTEQGPVVLTGDVPRTVEAVEELVG